MATKRVLYKPVQTNVGKKRNRRPLAQGRLVTAPSHPAPSGPRLKQGEADVSHLSGVSAPAPREDPNATPRRSVPHVTERHSPVASPPTHTLDLSDGEEVDTVQTTLMHTPRAAARQSPSSQVAVHHVPQVMVMDASVLSHSPHTADVDPVVSYERSHATVVCHNQPGTADSPRSKAGVWQIQVDQVPKVGSESPTAGAISPLSTDADPRELFDGADDKDAGEQVKAVTSQSSRHRKASTRRKQPPADKLPQPVFDESGDSEKTDSGGKGGKKGPQSVPGEMTSDSETCSLFEYVPQIKNRPKTADGVRKAPPKSEKKKKGERMVPSRYMQSALSKKLSNSSNMSGEKSVLAKKSLNLGSNNNSSGSRVAAGSAGKKTPSKTRSARTALSSSSPDSGQTQAPQGKTSTPTHDGIPVMASCDASAIQPELSMLSAIDASHLRLGGNGSGQSASQGSPRKQTKKTDPKVQQHRLDLAYSRYLQWLSVDSKASFMLQQQEKEAMKQLHTLWEMTEKKSQEKADLEIEVAGLQHLNALDEQLEIQHGALEPVARLLPALQKDYSGLAAALDTTLHQVQTRGIHIPKDEDFFLASLEQVLQESEQLLGTLSMLTKKQAPAVREFGAAVKATEKAVDAECLELYRCGELLSAVQSLATHENSLHIQAMQSTR